MIEHEVTCSIGAWEGKGAALIVWEDAAHEPGWVVGGEIHVERQWVETVGWVAAQDEHHIVIVQSFTKEGYAQSLQIPVGMILRVIPLGALDDHAAP